jgi:hypothetical protein
MSDQPKPTTGEWTAERLWDELNQPVVSREALAWTARQINASIPSAQHPLVELLRVAKCPACDGSGVISHQVGEQEWEHQKCQWCDERNAALAKVKDGK